MTKSFDLAMVENEFIDLAASLLVQQETATELHAWLAQSRGYAAAVSRDTAALANLLSDAYQAADRLADVVRAKIPAVFPRGGPAGRQAAASSVAATILEQLGGTGKLSAMIGARNFVDHGDGVSFKWPARGNAPNYCHVELDPSDTYAIAFYRIRGNEPVLLKEFNDIYADQLVQLFERTTGLYLSL